LPEVRQRAISRDGIDRLTHPDGRPVAEQRLLESEDMPVDADVGEGREEPIVDRLVNAVEVLELVDESIAGGGALVLRQRVVLDRGHGARGPDRSAGRRGPRAGRGPRERRRGLWPRRGDLEDAPAEGIAEALGRAEPALRGEPGERG